jgi:hypothetical protein
MAYGKLLILTKLLLIKDFIFKEHLPKDLPIRKNGVICTYCLCEIDGYDFYWCPEPCRKTKNVRGNVEDWSDRNNPRKIN